MLDRGFIYGDGVYELVPVYDRQPYRMRAAPRAPAAQPATASGLRNPHDAAEWESIIRDLIARTPFDDQARVFSGDARRGQRDHAFPAGVAPTVFMMSNPLVLPTRRAGRARRRSDHRDPTSAGCIAT